MKTGQRRLLQQKGWWKKEIFWWGRQKGSWMPKPTLKNNGNGHLAGSMQIPMSTDIPPCHCHWLEWTQPCYLLGQENHCLNETWGQNLLPWNSFIPSPPEKTWKTSTRMHTNSRGYPGEAGVRRLLKSSSIRKSSIPSRKASGSSGHLHSQRGAQRAVSSWCPLAWPTYQSLMLLTNKHMRRSPLLNRIHMREW